MSYTNGLDNPELYFQAKLYTGNAGSQSITFDGSESMQADLVWIKKRNGAADSSVMDSVRGVRKSLTTNNTEAEYTESAGLASFDSNGLTFDGSGFDHVNTSNTFVAWNWKESATSGFDIVSYTGTGSAKTESHSLSAVPHLMIVKNLAAVEGWAVYQHKNTAAPETDVLELDSTGATVDDVNRWNDTAPTSSVFTVGSHATTNQSSQAMIAYLWSEKQGFSKFGSYTGNGADTPNGVFIDLGFSPAFILIKATDINSWVI